MSDVFTRGSVLDERYEVERLLGGGGMGEVLLVRHLHLGDQRVVKILRRDLIGDRAADEAFLREARIATRIKHANVATLYDCSRLPQGSSYMVWEYIEGEDLETRLKSEKRLAVRAAVDIAIQTLRGLAAVHGAGVVHQDISPDNLMLSKDTGDRLQVKIIDLGLALLYNSSGVSALESSMGVAGKMAYCSPEQAQLEPGRMPDHRSDLYSLALVLYQMLSGELPFEADSPQKLFLRRLHQDPIPLVERAPDLEAAEKLDPILRRALSRKREERFPNAVSFIQALASVVESRRDGAESVVVEAAALEGDRVAQAMNLFERYIEQGKVKLARMTLDTIEEMAPEHPKLSELGRRLSELDHNAPDRDRLKYLVESGHKALVDGDLRQAERWLQMLDESAPQSEERRELAREINRRRDERSRSERIELHRQRLESLLARGDWEDAERELDALSNLEVTRVTLQNYGQRLRTGRERQQEESQLEVFERQFREACESRDWQGALDVAHRLGETDLAPERAHAMSSEARELEEDDRKTRSIEQGTAQLETLLASGDARGAKTALRILIGIDPEFEGRAEWERKVAELKEK